MSQFTAGLTASSKAHCLTLSQNLRVYGPWSPPQDYPMQHPIHSLSSLLQRSQKVTQTLFCNDPDPSPFLLRLLDWSKARSVGWEKEILGVSVLGVGSYHVLFNGSRNTQIFLLCPDKHHPFDICTNWSVQTSLAVCSGERQLISVLFL